MEARVGIEPTIEDLQSSFLGFPSVSTHFQLSLKTCQQSLYISALQANPVGISSFPTANWERAGTEKSGHKVDTNYGVQ